MIRYAEGVDIILELPEWWEIDETCVLLRAQSTGCEEVPTPEEMIDTLKALISKRDNLERRGYVGESEAYDEGIQYIYSLPTRSESELEKVVKDFNDI